MLLSITLLKNGIDYSASLDCLCVMNGMNYNASLYGLCYYPALVKYVFSLDYSSIM